MTFPDPEAQVRALWAAYDRGGIEAVREHVGPDVEWHPVAAGDTESGDVLGEWGRRHAERVTPVVHSLERHGECVLARGSLRIFRAGGFLDIQPSWVYFFRHGRLVRAVGYSGRAEALAAIEEFSAAP